jgi:hypothetical protein
MKLLHHRICNDVVYTVELPFNQILKDRFDHVDDIDNSMLIFPSIESLPIEGSRAGDLNRNIQEAVAIDIIRSIDDDVKPLR